jgi:hypothetical protein
MLSNLLKALGIGVVESQIFLVSGGTSLPPPNPHEDLCIFPGTAGETFRTHMIVMTGSKE